MWDRFKEEENELFWSKMDIVEIVEVEGMLDGFKVEGWNLFVCRDIAH